LEKNLLTDDNLWANSEGTATLVDFTNELGIHPTRNFTFGVNEEKDRLNADAVAGAKLADRACASCPLACGKYTRINGAAVEGPEYETLCLGGSNCGINDLEQVIRFNRLCDDLGLDTISCGGTIGLAMDLTERDIRDYGLKFGAPDEYLKVVSEIATLSTQRGRDLAMGVKRLALKHRAENLSSEAKGLELPAYEPRGNYGMGLAYATSERGGCHLRAFTVAADDPFDLEAMAKEVKGGQDFNALKWSMCFCDFWGTVTPEIMAELLSAGLGERVDPGELIKAGERIWNLGRLFNVKAGFGKDDDVLPEKTMTTPLKKGPHDGNVFSKEDFESARGIYYQLRGWDENGRPSDEKIIELGLKRL